MSHRIDWEVGRTYLIKKMDKYDDEVVEFTLFRITDYCLGFTYDDPEAGKITIRRKWLEKIGYMSDWIVVDSYVE